MFRELKNASISGDQVSKGIVNDYVQILGVGNHALVPPGPKINVSGYSGGLLIGDIPQGQTKNLFGWHLKQNGEYISKYLVCRATANVIQEAPSPINRYYGIYWSIYDADTETYTDVTSYKTDAGLGTVGSIDWSDMFCYCVFHIAQETYWGTPQTMIYGGLYLFSTLSNYGFDYIGRGLGMQGIGMQQHLSQYDLDIEEVVISPEFGPESEPEGYEAEGGFDDSSDVIGMPSKPQSVLSLGFINVYKCDAGSLVQLGSELFPEIQFPSSLSDVGEVLAAISDSIWNAKLIDYVISIHCVPGNVSGGNLTDIKIGTRTMTGILARPVSDEYVDFDFGSITIPLYYKNYIDYMTEIQLFLPFYGFVSLRPEEIIGGEINVKYRFNIIDGSFSAYIFATSNRSKLQNSLIGQYGGSCVVHLPVSNMSYASMFSGLIGGAASAAIGVASGAGAAAAAGALTSAASVANALQGGDVKKSNSYNASSSFMSRRKPYLIVTRPVSSFSSRYNKESGLPSNVAMTLGQCSGFTVAEDIILDGIPCTSDEKERIRNYFKTGVIIR